MAQNPTELSLAPAQTEHSPFQVAVHHALADQKAIFTRMVGPPQAEEKEKEQSDSPPNANQGKSKKRRATNPASHTPSGLPEELRRILDDYRRELADTILSAKDFPALLHNLEAYIAKEHEQLFYHTNDWNSAVTKSKYIMIFIDTLCAHLSKTNQLDIQHFKRLEQLEEMYQLGLEAFEVACNRVSEYSPDGNQSLVVAAKRQEQAEKQNIPPEGKQPVSLTLEERTHKIMRDLLQNAYGIESQHEVPLPLLILLGKRTETLANSQIQAEHPHCDFRHPDYADNTLIQDRYGDLLESLEKRVEGHPSLRQLYDIYHDLDRQIRKAQRLPNDFSEMIEAAAQQAEKETDQQMASIFKIYQETRPLPLPRAERMLKEIHPGYDTLENLRYNFDSLAERMHVASDSLEKQELLDFIDIQLDILNREIAVHGYHPATALAAKEYITAFRQHLGTALYDAGCHDEQFLVSLSELEFKADMMSENQRALANWAMFDSAGGHDNLFMAAFVNLGSDTVPMSSDDQSRIVLYAGEELVNAAEARGIHPALAELEYIPLIFTRCWDIAQAELAQDFHREQKEAQRPLPPEAAMRSWVANISGTKKEDFPSEKGDFSRKRYGAGVPLTSEEQRMGAIVYKRAHNLLAQAMQCLMPEELSTRISKMQEDAAKEEKVAQAEQEQKAPAEAAEKTEETTDPFDEYPIALSAHNLRIVMDFLDEMDRRREPLQRH